MKTDTLSPFQASTSPLEFSITNEYPPLGSLKYYPWEYIVEPHRQSTISVLNTELEVRLDRELRAASVPPPEAISVPQDDSTTYNWYISKDGELIHAAEGPTTVFVFTEAAAEYDIELERTVRVPSGKQLHLRHAKAMCKYVRREIRALTNIDREVRDGSPVFTFCEISAAETSVSSLPGLL